jgi:hypothetical protein
VSGRCGVQLGEYGVPVFVRIAACEYDTLMQVFCFGVVHHAAVL